MTDQLDLDQPQPRPGFLTTLCVLTFIWTGLSILGSFFSLAWGKQSAEQMMASKVELTKQMSEMKRLGMDGFADFFEKLILMGEESNNNFYIGIFVSLVVVGIGLFAALKMWNGFKIGFHLYIVYSLLSVVAIYSTVSPSNVPSFIIIVSLILSGLFVFLYSRNLHWLNK
ncbi:MAG: hypothetical protein COA33_008505 [Fluviicola sp.]|nr:hypothetical protein [Fluviicola sp.]